jgi:hypothetical protein
MGYEEEMNATRGGDASMYACVAKASVPLFFAFIVEIGSISFFWSIPKLSTSGRHHFRT